jgi:hypothetical protein
MFRSSVLVPGSDSLEPGFMFLYKIEVVQGQAGQV